MLQGTVKWFDDDKATPLSGQGHGDHFYTTSSSERDSAVNVHGYRAESVACYVFQSRQAGSTALYRLFRP